MNVTDLIQPNHALFLDFDGTLVDIAPHPDDVRVPSGLVGTLLSLQQRLGGALALVSGRPIAQIDAMLEPLTIAVAGVHGAERRRSDGGLDLAETHSLLRVRQAADDLVAAHPTLFIEEKRGSLALHYRRSPELESICVDTLRAAVGQSPGLAVLVGKMVVEAKPAAASKGQAIEAYMAEPPFAGRTPVFLGDDVTDEIGFSTVQAMGGDGVKVGDGDSAARHRLESPADVRRLLAAAVRAGSLSANAEASR